MLRKKAQFRPNIAATTPSTNVPAAKPDTEPATNTLNTDNHVAESTALTPQTSASEGVAEAIAQLAGHKFEPVKLSSINLANKNIKIKDLLFLNPPPTRDQKRHKKNETKRRKKQLQEGHTRTHEGSEKVAERDPSLVPQVKMGPDGKLVLDESSTIINCNNPIKSQEAIVEDEEDVCKTNYDSFRTRSGATKWSTDETQKFYHALTILGTDFSLMESLFFSGHRSRTELHKKFKREERMNKSKVEIALSNRIPIDGEELEGLKKILLD